MRALAFAALLTLGAGIAVAADGPTPPEFYGLYAIEGNRYVDIGEGLPAAGPTVTATASFLLYDKLVGAGVFGSGLDGSLSLRRSPSDEERELFMVASPIAFRVKPVREQPEMIQLVPVGRLKPGRYEFRADRLSREGRLLGRFTIPGPSTPADEDPEAVEARKGMNEASAIGALRTLTTAQALFREGDKDRNNTLDYAASLAALEKVGLIDKLLGAGKKRGYVFAILAGSQYQWEAVASPAAPGRSGDRHFYVDESGVIRFATAGPATSQSTAVGG